MANSTTGFGFQVTGVATGVTPSFGTFAYPINYSYATTIGRGCLVELNSSGEIILSTPASTNFLGVFDGAAWTPSTGGRVNSNAYVYSATTVAGSVVGYVYTDPNATYMARVSGGPLVAADVGANITFVAGTVNTTTGLSTDLASATLTTTNTSPWRVVGIEGATTAQGVNDPSSTYNIVRLKLNASALSNTTGVV